MEKTEGAYVSTLNELREVNPKPIVAKKMVTRAKSSATKLKLPSKKAGAKIMVKKMKSVVRKSTAGKAGQEEEKKGPVNVVRNLRRAVKNIKVPSKEEPLRAPVSDQERKKRPKKKFQYEMDCADVENIDIIDFQNYVRENMKVANRKNNKCLKVKVVRGMTVVVKSSVYMAKKTLRTVTYKYLDHKKITMVHVRCETPTSYKLISDC